MQNLSADELKEHLTTTEPLLWDTEDILRECKISRTTLWRRRQHDFPAEINISKNITRWYSAEVKEWVKSHQIQSSKNSI